MKSITETDEGFVCEISAPCFARLNSEEIDLIRESKTQVLFRKGDTLTKQGAFSSYVLFMISGIARKYIESEDGRTFNLSLVGQGEFIGLSAVFSLSKFVYSVTAITDCQVMIIEKSSLQKVIDGNGGFAMGLIKRHCEQNSELFETLNNQLFKQMNGRLAGSLLYLNDIKYNGLSVFGLLGRKDIAEFAGISTESAVKLLKTFDKEGIIELHDKNIEIIKPEVLREIWKRG